MHMELLGISLQRYIMFAQGDKLVWSCYGIHVDGGLTIQKNKCCNGTECSLQMAPDCSSTAKRKKDWCSLLTAQLSPFLPDPILCGLQYLFTSTVPPHRTGGQQKAGLLSAGQPSAKANFAFQDLNCLSETAATCFATINGGNFNSAIKHPELLF